MSRTVSRRQTIIVLCFRGGEILEKQAVAGSKHAALPADKRESRGADRKPDVFVTKREDDHGLSLLSLKDANQQTALII